MLVPYKCGFSTMRAALVTDPKQPIVETLMRPGDSFALAEHTVMFVREPKDRLKSYYRNWFLEPTHGVGPEQTQFRKAKRLMRPAAFQRLMTASPDERNTSDFFMEFLYELGPGIMNDEHTQPLWSILSPCQADVDEVSEILNFKENIPFLEKHYGIKQSVKNTSKRLNPDPLDCPELDDYCQRMYGRDYEMFGRYF
ncbi:MAG: sulfotransferase family 2 domain-containing protein [Rhodobacteraceae bacterium]|nr:sulfotransferase family 2 domain-containing protein [Paracoccaceae bacterium]